MVRMLRCCLILLLLPAPDPVDLLGSPDAAVRERAADQLERGRSASVPSLRQALLHPDLEIRLRAKEILFRLEPSLFLEDLKNAQRPDDAGMFSFCRKLWIEGPGDPATVLTTTLEQSLFSSLTWDVDAVRTGCEVQIRRCGLHSPRLILVPAEVADPVQVRIRGQRRWSCRVPLTFRNPRDGDSRRVGPYTVTLRWPIVVIECVSGVSSCVLEESDIDWTPRTEEVLPFLYGLRSPCCDDDEPAIYFPEAAPQPESPTTWCGCLSPKAAPPPAPAGPPTAGPQRLPVFLRSEPAPPITDLTSVQLIFHLPVQENFEVLSEPLD